MRIPHSYCRDERDTTAGRGAREDYGVDVFHDGGVGLSQVLARQRSFPFRPAEDDDAQNRLKQQGFVREPKRIDITVSVIIHVDLD